MEITPPKKFREIDSSHFTSFLAWTFLNFLAHCAFFNDDEFGRTQIFQEDDKLE